MTNTDEAQQGPSTQARRALLAAQTEERFQAIKQAEEEQLEERTRRLRAQRLAREGRDPAQGG